MISSQASPRYVNYVQSCETEELSESSESAI